MTVVGEINFFSDEVLRKRLFWLGIAIMFPAVLLCVIRAFGIGGSGAETISGLPSILSFFPFVGWLFVLLVTTIVILPIHELIHGLFFKLCGGPGTHVSFGYENAMFYTACPGNVFSKWSFVLVLLAPTVLVSTVCLAAAFISGLPFLCLSVFFLHLSGCVGDILAAWQIITHPTCTHCEDTDYGVKLLAK